MNRNALILIVFLVLFGGSAYFYLSTSLSENSGKVTISDAIAMPAGNSDTSVMIALQLTNEGPPQTITAVSSPDSRDGMFHGSEGNGKLVIPADSNAAFAMDGAHLMLMGLEGELADGRLITIKLDLEPAGSVTTKARLSTRMTMAHGSHQMNTDSADQDNQSSGHGGHFMVPDGELKPALSVSISPTSDGSGWQLTAKVSDFAFDRENVDGDHIPGTGHGHLYLNGLKLGRVYHETVNIGRLPKGTHKVRLTLNTNNHRIYMVDGKPVTATAEIKVD